MSPDSGGDQLQMLDARVFLAGGEVDFQNRYSSVVMVTTGDPWEGESCSGVLLTPRFVLTAGHCVCKRRRAAASDDAAESVMDVSTCMDTAHATTVVYRSGEARIGTGGQTRAYRGRVLPHPEFKLLLDQRERVLSGKADLALIELDDPVEGHVPVLPLADTAAQQGEPLVMAGYGYGGAVGAMYGLRYSRRNKVARSEGTVAERVLYEQQGAYLYNGFGGGPCFREQGGKRWLVGIASLGSDEELTFTDLRAYRDWLKTALHDARGSRHQQRETPQ